MTAEGLLMRLLLGWDRNIPQLAKGLEFLGQFPPMIHSPASSARDAYYWYYATQVFFHVQGQPWESWNRQMQAALHRPRRKGGSRRQLGPFGSGARSLGTCRWTNLRERRCTC